MEILESRVTDPDPSESGELHELAHSLDTLIRRACERDDGTRKAIAGIARWLASISHQTDGSAEPPAIEPPAPQQSETLPIRLGNQIVELKVPVETPVDAVRAREATPAPPSTFPAFEPDRETLPDLALVSKRCQLKGEACRWAIRRRGLVADNADFASDIRPSDATFRERCEPLDDCILWMLSSHGVIPSDGSLEQVAACYDVLADAADLTRSVFETRDESGQDGDDIEDSYHLLAEAQSALRKALEDADYEPYDRDQMDAFRWLKIRTTEDEIFVRQHMRLNDPADPTNSDPRAERIAKLRDRRESRERASKRRTSLLNKTRYHARRIAVEPEDQSTDWQTLLHTVVDLVGENHIRPSNVDLREILMPIFEAPPENLEIPDSVNLVFREIDRYLATREQAEPDTQPSPLPSPETERAIELLRGKTVVLLGGELRPKSKSAIQRDLQLKELRWIALPDHHSLAKIEPSIARPDVDVVLLLKRWCSHMHEDVRALCDRHEKIYVRIPAGYNSNQIAHQVLEQASEQLSALS